MWWAFYNQQAIWQTSMNLQAQKYWFPSTITIFLSTASIYVYELFCAFLSLLIPAGALNGYFNNNVSHRWLKQKSIKTHSISNFSVNYDSLYFLSRVAMLSVKYSTCSTDKWLKCSGPLHYLTAFLVCNNKPNKSSP